MNTSPSNLSAPGYWRMARRLLVAAAVLATLIAVFYTVENWRGKRAWDNCRREMETKGDVLDWSAYIPAPVPDDQNFYKAPHMREWFVKDSFSSISSLSSNRPFAPAQRTGSSLAIAEVQVTTPNAPLNSEHADAVLTFDDPAARGQAAALFRATIGPCVISTLQWPLVARPLDEIKPSHWVLKSDTMPTAKEIAALLPRSPLTSWTMAYSDDSFFQVEPAGNNAFHLSLKAPVYSAAEYLAWTEPLTPNFDLVRKALDRPYARIDCDYQQPYAIGIPNFLTLRDVAQTLSQRAQCHLLLGEAEAAWHDLALIHDVCQILEAKAPRRPVTLVGAMINVAIAAVYAGVIEDGLRLHAWHEPQLLALEKQLQDTDLLTPVAKAFQEERAATCRTFEVTPRRELVKLFNFDSSARKLAVSWMPRGWFYQNMAAGTEFMQEWLSCVDPINQLVPAQRITETVHRASLKFGHGSPYSFLFLIALPNVSKALRTTALNQTRINQARLACALERFRLAQGQYPERLEALTPRFVENLPHDLIGGEPLHYRRTDNGGYLLYSIGWDEKDNGGVVGKTKDEGDWVWETN